MPEVFDRSLVTYRVSAFGSDITALGQSASYMSSYQGDNVVETGNESKRPMTSVREETKEENSMPVPGGWPLEHAPTPLLHVAHRSKSTGRGEDKTDLVVSERLKQDIEHPGYPQRAYEKTRSGG